MILYVITNSLNGLRYVGITSRSLGKRWAEHISDAQQGRGWALHEAIRVFGPEAFRVEPIESQGDWESFCRKEQDLIAELGCLVPNGYNICAGGEGTAGYSHTEATKAKIAKAHKGKKLTADHRAKLSAAKVGKKRPPRSAEHSARIAAGLRKAWARRKADK